MTQSNDIASRIDAHAQNARELTLDIKTKEEQLSNLKAELKHLLENTLPDLMDEINSDHHGVKADGNKPAMDIKVVPFYSANIAANWPEEQREEAFKTLEEYNAGDLIKHTIELAFSRDEHEFAKALHIKLLQQMNGHRCNVSLHSNVSHMTLKAWLKEQVEAGNELPPLDTIGAKIGRIATIKERK